MENLWYDVRARRTGERHLVSGYRREATDLFATMVSDIKKTIVGYLLNLGIELD